MNRINSAAVPLAVALLLGTGLGLGPARALRAEGGASVRTDLGARPSHHGLYRAQVVETGGRVRAGRSAHWTVRVTGPSGEPLRGGSVEASAWLLDGVGAGVGRRLRVDAGPEPGRYRIRGVRADGPGWWAVKLDIRSPAGTDSLAFNLIVGDRPAGGERWSARELEAIRSLWIGSLPQLPPDPSNRWADHDAAAALGHRLFFDSRLSSTGTVSCATCHTPDRDFQDDVPLAVGVGVTDRRTMPVAGTAYSPWLFWDGRADSQWAQALGPLESPVEHGGSRGQYARLIAEQYRAEYEAIFGRLPDLRSIPPSAGPVRDPVARAAWDRLSERDRDAVTAVFVNMGKAMAAYQRLLQFGPSRFDRYAESLLAGGAAPAGVLTRDEVAGLRLFIGKAGCIDCHNGPLLSNHDFHNTGVPAAPGLPPDVGRAEGARAVLAHEFNCRSRWSDAPADECAELDFMVADGHDLLRAFKTPTLRNVAERGPYMHAGQVATLEDVIAHYDLAPRAPAGHSEIRPLRLSRGERAQLEAYLRTLTGPMATDPSLLVDPHATTVR